MYRVVKNDGYIYYYNLGYVDELPEAATNVEFGAGQLKEHKIQINGITKRIAIPYLPCRWVSKNELIESVNNKGFDVEYVEYLEESTHILAFLRK